MAKKFCCFVSFFLLFWLTAIAASAQEENETKQIIEEISFLRSEAKQLRESKKLSGAIQKYEAIIQKYEEVLALHGDMSEAKEAIKEMKPEKQDYLDKVHLYDLKAGYYTTYLKDEVAGVKFKIKNIGNHTLKQVEVSVYFKDAKGTVITEEQYYPVSEYALFSGNNKPLKPNYIWQLEQGKFYRADSLPTEWKEGSVSANITNIEFAK